MANNNIGWGSIYATSYWGLPTQTGWGDIYYNDANPTPPAPPKSEKLHFVVDTSLSNINSAKFAKWQGTGWNYDIEWGDGTTQTGLTGTSSHNYSAPVGASYELFVSGNVPQPFSAGIFLTDAEALQITEIKSWGTLEYWTLTFALQDTGLTTLDMSGFTWISGAQGNAYSLCGNCRNLTSVNMNGIINSERTTSLGSAFQSNFTNLLRSIEWGDFNFSGIDTGGALSMSGNAVEIMTPTQYDYLLNKLVNTTFTSVGSRSLTVGASKYNSGQGKTDRDTLVANGWTITDGGQV